MKRGGEEGGRGRGRLSTTAVCGALNRSEEEGKGKVRDLAGFLGVLPYRGFSCHGMQIDFRVVSVKRIRHVFHQDIW